MSAKFAKPFSALTATKSTVVYAMRKRRMTLSFAHELAMLDKQRGNMTVDDCLKNLAETDEPCARAKARMLGLELQLKVVRATELKLSTGKTVTDREADALTSERYMEMLNDYENAVADYHILFNQRNTWQAGFEYWRSNNANRRQAGGNV